MHPDRIALPLRIVVQDPLPGLAIALQRGKAELVGRAQSDSEALAFDFGVEVEGALADGRPRILGPHVQGPPTERFVYLCVGRNAGQAASPWGGRVKVPLGGLSWALIESLPDAGRLEGRIGGRGRKDGPALATVQILAPGWIVASR